MRCSASVVPKHITTLQAGHRMGAEEDQLPETMSADTQQAPLLRGWVGVSATSQSRRCRSMSCLRRR